MLIYIIIIVKGMLMQQYDRNLKNDYQTLVRMIIGMLIEELHLHDY